jgi:hypothetical protein
MPNTIPKKARETRARREAQNIGFYDGEYMETMEESVYKYAPHQRYEKAVSYMEMYCGLPPKEDMEHFGEKSVLAVYFTDGSEFVFSGLKDVYYVFPFGKPEEHSMTITNSKGTLFAFANGHIDYAKGLSFTIGSGPGQINIPGYVAMRML